jgi:RNA recognition motif-containing protein
MANEEAKLFVAGLPDSMSEEALKQIFEATGGKVVNVSLPKDRTTGRPRGFGFVTLATPEEAQTARSALDGSLQGGRSISVRPFQAEPPKRGEGGGGGPYSSGPRSGGPGSRAGEDERKLYVGNLPYDCSQQDIEKLVNEAAGSAGTVVHVSLPIGPDGRKKGYGFVLLSSADAAKAAVNALQNASMRGRPLKVNMAQPKGDRPPRSDGFGGGGFGGGGFGGGGFGGGGGGFGGGGPPPSRKTFDGEGRKRRGSAGSAKTEEGPPRRKKDRERGGGGSGRDDDWYSGGDDDKD